MRDPLNPIQVRYRAALRPVHIELVWDGKVKEPRAVDFLRPDSSHDQVFCLWPEMGEPRPPRTVVAEWSRFQSGFLQAEGVELATKFRLRPLGPRSHVHTLTAGCSNGC